MRDTTADIIINEAYLYQSDIDTKLFRAFNPDRELKDRTPWQKLMATQPPVNDQLTKEERIVQSSMIRRQLLANLTSSQFKTLQLFYQQFQINDLPRVIELFTPLIRLVISEARLLANNCNLQFASLVCLSTAWNTNLFRIKPWGPADRYYYATAACRKRRRLNNALEIMRKDAMKQANRVLES